MLSKVSSVRRSESLTVVISFRGTTQFDGCFIFLRACRRAPPSVTLKSRAFRLFFWSDCSLRSQSSARNGCPSLMRPSSRSGLTLSRGGSLMCSAREQKHPKATEGFSRRKLSRKISSIFHLNFINCSFEYRAKKTQKKLKNILTFWLATPKN